MKTASRIATLHAALRQSGGPIVLVPTMGALHAGHAALISEGRRVARRSGTVVVSIFVNPTQFRPGEDLSTYPRPVAADRKLSRSLGVDVIFQPTVEEMYSPDYSITVTESALSTGLCGASRPGHFAGVGTVVSKLFNIVQPDFAIFGEKDWQQLAIIRRLVRDLNFPITILGVPTVREPDGLALSSRNTFLTPEERAAAPAFPAALHAAAARKSPAAIQVTAERLIQQIPGARLDYVAVVDAATLEPIRTLRRPGRLLAAIFLGKTRLIDNVPVAPQA